MTLKDWDTPLGPSKELGNTPADKDYKPSGISKAQEAALKAYPEKWTWGFGGRASFKYDQNGLSREACKRGYEQAEKDLALTIQDLELLHTFLYAVKNNKHGTFTFTRLSDEQYQEVLKRFKEAKK